MDLMNHSPGEDVKRGTGVESQRTHETLPVLPPHDVRSLTAQQEPLRQDYGFDQDDGDNCCNPVGSRRVDAVVGTCLVDNMGTEITRSPREEFRMAPATTTTTKPSSTSLKRRPHHLLRHSLPESAAGVNALPHFGVNSIQAAISSIQSMSQRELQTVFERIYNARSLSNNNRWLRKKLFGGMTGHYLLYE